MRGKQVWPNSDYRKEEMMQETGLDEAVKTYVGTQS